MGQLAQVALMVGRAGFKNVGRFDSLKVPNRAASQPFCREPRQRRVDHWPVPPPAATRAAAAQLAKGGARSCHRGLSLLYIV